MAVGTYTKTAPPQSTVIYSEALTSRTTNGNTTGAIWPADTVTAWVSVNVGTFTGGTNVTVSLQQLDANLQWVTVGSTAALTATGTAGFSVGPGTNNGNVIYDNGGQYRIAWVVSGVFSALTFQVSIIGR